MLSTSESSDTRSDVSSILIENMAVNEDRKGWPDVEDVLCGCAGCTKYADPGSVVTPKQFVFIDDTHESVFAVPL